MQRWRFDHHPHHPNHRHGARHRRHHPSSYRQLAGSSFFHQENTHEPTTCIFTLCGYYPHSTFSFIHPGLRANALFEAHWYVSNLGDVYLTSNRRPPYHDAVGVLYNFTTKIFQEVTAAKPPYITGGVVNPNPFANTFWDEFFTPDPSRTHTFFMSDRATTSASNLGVDPEWSDHYMCDGAGCSNPTRLTYFNDTGIDATLSCGPGGPDTKCFPITAAERRGVRIAAK